MRATRVASLLFALAAAALGQVGTVQNAATYQGSIPGFGFFLTGGFGLTGTLAASISEVTILGTPANIISPRMLAVLSYPVPFRNPVILDPIAAPVAQPVNAVLYIRPAGSTTLIPVSNISSAVTGAITFVVPGYTPLGGAELLYQIDNGPTQWTNVTVVQSSFAFYRTGFNGPALAQALPSSGPGSPVGLASPIQSGQTLLLTGSGLGYGTTVTATIGGVSAPVIYAGPSGTAAGHDQILLQVPPGVTDGCYVPVAVTFNKATLTTSISETAGGSPCRHPWQLSLSDMKTLDSGGSLFDGTIDLQTGLSVVTATAGSRNESASLSIGSISAGELAGYFQASPVQPGCNVLTANNVAFAGLVGGFGIVGNQPGPPPPPVPDVGSSARLQSPTTAIQFISPGNVTGVFNAQGVPPATDGPLSSLPVPAIAGGKWTFQTSGGADLGPSSFGFMLPAPVQFTGGVPAMINHTQDQTVSWNGAAFDAGATALVTLSGSGLVSCTAPANAGAVSIPASLLSGFSANTIGTLSINISEAGAYLPHTEFQTKAGAALLLFVSFSSSDSRPVFFQ